MGESMSVVGGDGGRRGRRVGGGDWGRPGCSPGVGGGVIQAHDGVGQRTSGAVFEVIFFFFFLLSGVKYCYPC